jgi:hypothetical protein
MALSRTTLQAIAGQMAEAATMHLKRDGYVAFAPIVIKEGRTLPINISDGCPKDEIGQLLRQFARHADAVVIIDEVWMRCVEVDEVPAATSQPVRDHPERQEGFFVSVQAPAGSYVCVFKFDREPKTGVPLDPTEHYRGWETGNSLYQANFQSLFAS